MAGGIGVIFDRDGTLTEDAGGYTYRVEDLKLVRGAAEAIADLNRRAIPVLVATNQSGIARGLFTLADMERFHDALQAELSRFGAQVDAFYACPFHPDAVIAKYRAADHPDRKPNPGMLLRAIAEHNLDPTRTLMIGDDERDMQAAAAAGVRGVRYQGGDLAALVRAETAGL